MDELRLDRAVAHAIAGLHGDERRVRWSMLAQLGANQRQRQRRSDDGDVPLAQQIRNAADMVFVPVRDENRTQLVAALADVVRSR